MGCNLLLALSEVFTFTVIYAAVNLLNADADLQHFRWFGLSIPAGNLASMGRG